jgi:ADP-ribosylglycohydrolase
MTAMSKHKLANIEGAMLGLAIGDALGFPVEFMSPGARSAANSGRRASPICIQQPAILPAATPTTRR